MGSPIGSRLIWKVKVDLRNLLERSAGKSTPVYLLIANNDTVPTSFWRERRYTFYRVPSSLQWNCVNSKIYRYDALPSEVRFRLLHAWQC